MITDAAAFIGAQGPGGLLALYWFFVLFEAPRYLVGSLAAIPALIHARNHPPARTPDGRRVSVIMAGHNEADGLEACIRSLRMQTVEGCEIVVVDDGSTDGMYDVVRRLERRGLVQRSARLELRGGKAAATNLAARLATGDILVLVDCDGSFDRKALAEVLAPFSDPAIGAVSGNVLVRNARASIVTGIQACEYLVTITLGRTVLDAFGQVNCISGAFGAYRRSAWERIGGNAMGSGEDFDMTLRLREAGYEIAFAPRAICMTDAPESLLALIRQRRRWERDSFWIRFRKFGRWIDPTDRRFRLRESVHQVEFIVFNLAAAVLFPIYLVHLFATLGPGALLVLASVSIPLAVLDAAIVAACGIALGRGVLVKAMPFALVYGLHTSYLMRFVRLWAYAEEWIASRSLQDEFIPAKVRRWGSW